MTARTFTVRMGQAFYEDLPAKLRSMGGRVSAVDRGAVEVSVNVAFARPRSAESVQRELWREWTSCSVEVVPRERPVPFTSQRAVRGLMTRIKNARTRNAR